MRMRMKTFKGVAIDHIETAFNEWAENEDVDQFTVQMQTQYSSALQKFITVILYTETEKEVQDDQDESDGGDSG
jgi:hypothetical protein